jgi:hypothetical protein
VGGDLFRLVLAPLLLLSLVSVVASLRLSCGAPHLGENRAAAPFSSGIDLMSRWTAG